MDCTIVIPVFNGESKIAKCIQAAQASAAGLDFEIIVVNDGSTDSTAAVLEDITSASQQVKAIHQQNSGWASRPRNVGLASATGEYVYFLDSDDYLTPGSLKRAVHFAKSVQSDISLVKITSEKRKLHEDVFAETTVEPRLYTLVRSNFVFKLWRTSFLKENNLTFDESLRRLEDAVFCFTAYSLTSKISIYADEDVCLMDRFSDGNHISASNIDWEVYPQTVFKALDPLLKSTFNPDDIERAVADFIRRVALTRLNEPWSAMPIKNRYGLAKSSMRIVSRYFDSEQASKVFSGINILKAICAINGDYVGLHRIARNRRTRSVLNVALTAVNRGRVAFAVSVAGRSGLERLMPDSVENSPIHCVLAPEQKGAELIEVMLEAQPTQGTYSVELPVNKMVPERNYYIRISAMDSTGDAYESTYPQRDPSGKFPEIRQLQSGRVNIHVKGFNRIIVSKPRRWESISRMVEVLTRNVKYVVFNQGPRA